MSEEFKKYALKIEDARLKINELASIITPPADYGGTYLGVMEKQYFVSRPRPTRPYEFFDLRWRIISKFPKFQEVHLIVGMEHITLTVGGEPVEESVIHDKRDHIEAMLDQWQMLADIRDR